MIGASARADDLQARIAAASRILVGTGLSIERTTSTTNVTVSIDAKSAWADMVLALATAPASPGPRGKKVVKLGNVEWLGAAPLVDAVDQSPWGERVTAGELYALNSLLEDDGLAFGISTSGALRLEIARELRLRITGMKEAKDFEFFIEGGNGEILLSREKIRAGGAEPDAIDLTIGWNESKGRFELRP